MPSQLDVFHPRHAGSPIKFSENHKALVSPAKGGSVLIIDAHAKVDLRPLQSQTITVPTALALGKYLSSGRPAIDGQSALAYFDPNNIAIKGRGDEVNCLKALYTLLKAKKLTVYRWPYKLPVGIRPNPRAGVSNFKKSPVPLPPTPDELDVLGLMAETRRKLQEKGKKAPMPDMPDGYCPVKREPPPDVGSIKPLEGNKYKGLFKHLVRENTGGVLFGDTGSVNSFKPSPQDIADIEAYRKAHPEDYAAITLIAPGNKVKLPSKVIGNMGAKGDDIIPDAILKLKSLKLWDKSIIFGGRRVFQRNDLFNPKHVDDNGVTNLDRMKKGRAPIGYDGEPVNLHHLIQKEPGTIAEVGGKLHSEKTKTLHIPQYEKVGSKWKQRKNYSFRAHDGRKKDWPRTKSGKVQKTQAEKDFIKWSSDYWKERAKGY